MNAFDAQAKMADREGLLFIDDLRSLMRQAQTRSEARRVEAMTSASIVDLQTVLEQARVKRDALKD